MIYNQLYGLCVDCFPSQKAKNSDGMRMNNCLGIKKTANLVGQT